MDNRLYLPNGISRGAQESTRKLSKNLSKQNKHSLESIHESQDSSSQETEDEEVWPLDDKDEKERKAIDYLKELGENEEEVVASNFETGLRNFCLSNFLENEHKKSNKEDQKKSARNTLLSLLPRNKELTEPTAMSPVRQSPTMQQHLENLDSGRHKKPIKIGPTPVASYKIKGLKSQEDVESKIKQKTELESERERNGKAEALGVDGNLNAYKRVPLQVGTATFYKERPRHGTQEEDGPTGRMPANLRAVQPVSRQTKSRLFHDAVLYGRSMSLPRLEKSRENSGMTRNSIGFDEVGIPIVINGGLGLVSLNKKDNKDEIKIRREGDKEPITLGNKGGQLGKAESSKENLQNIVKAALMAKNKPVFKVKQGSQDSFTQRDIRHTTVNQFWNYNKDNNNNNKESPKRGQSRGKVKVVRAHTESPEREKKEREKESKEVRKFSPDLQSRTMYQSMRWIQAESRNVIAGIQGRSFVVTQALKDPKHQGSLVIEDLDDRSSSRLHLRESFRDPIHVKSSNHSPHITGSKASSQPHSQSSKLLASNPKAYAHGLFHKFKSFHKDKYKAHNVGNLTARLTSNEDLLTGVSMSKDFNETKMASGAQGEDGRASVHPAQTPFKDKRYTQLRKKIRGTTSSKTSRREETMMSTFSADVKIRPMAVSLYSWDANFVNPWSKQAII